MKKISNKLHTDLLRLLSLAASSIEGKELKHLELKRRLAQSCKKLNQARPASKTLRPRSF